MQREQDPAHLVHARFEGMVEAVRSQAVLTTDGVRLSAALPFLQPGSKVESRSCRGTRGCSATGWSGTPKSSRAALTASPG